VKDEKGKKMKKSSLVLLVIIGIILIITFVIMPRYRQSQSAKAINKPAPNFELAWLDGSKLTSNDLSGKVVVLDFWATWCGPCQAEFPEFQKLYEKYKDNPGISFVAVNSSWRGDTPQKAQAFIQAKAYIFPVAYDDGGQVAQRFNVTGIPTTFILDKKEVVRSTQVGFDSSKDYVGQMSAIIDDLLAEK
jgi:thiol-disulfide isomerase/thioredoxin